jgi:hypothetical protein
MCIRLQIVSFVVIYIGPASFLGASSIWKELFQLRPSVLAFVLPSDDFVSFEQNKSATCIRVIHG